MELYFNVWKKMYERILSLWRYIYKYVAEESLLCITQSSTDRVYLSHLLWLMRRFMSTSGTTVFLAFSTYVQQVLCAMYNWLLSNTDDNLIPPSNTFHLTRRLYPEIFNRDSKSLIKLVRLHRAPFCGTHHCSLSHRNYHSYLMRASSIHQCFIINVTWVVGERKCSLTI